MNPRIVAGVIITLLVLSCAGLIMIFLDQDSSRSNASVARYGRFSFEGRRFSDGQRFIKVFSGDYPSAPKLLYVKFPDGRIFALEDIPEDLIAGMFKGRPAWEARTQYGDFPSSIFTFKSGRLSLGQFDETMKGVQFGPTQDGPFLTLPIHRKKLIEVFGEPQEWGEVSHHGIP